MNECCEKCVRVDQERRLYCGNPSCSCHKVSEDYTPAEARALCDAAETPQEESIAGAPVAGHRFGAKGKGSKGKGHPIMYGKPSRSLHFDEFPDGGGYPYGFVEWAMKEMGCDDPAKILHLCSGSMKTGTRVDIRPEVNPDIVADCRAVPLPDESVDFIMADPPYSLDYAENLYGTGKDYPKPGEILKEAARLLKPGGKIGLLHFLVPMTRKPMKMLGVYGVTTGAGYAIRAWTLWQKQP